MFLNIGMREVEGDPKKRGTVSDAPKRREEVDELLRDPGYGRPQMSHWVG